MPKLSLSKDQITSSACDLIAIAVYKGGTLGPGGKEVEQALGVSLDELAEQAPLMDKRFDGSLGQVVAVPTLGKLAAKQVLLVGVGEKGDAKVAVARKAGALLARKAGGAKTVCTTIPLAFRGNAADVAGAFVEGFLLGSYRYEFYKAEQNGKPNRVDDLSLMPAKNWDARKVRDAFARAEAMVEGTNIARDLKNTPSLDKSPESLAAEARRIAKGGLKIKVLDEKELEKRGFGGILGVGRGSPKPPRLIELRYDPANGKSKRTVAIVGKGITFDSGGINLKPGEGMDWMKMDMGGAAAVLGAMHTIAKLKPKVAVRGYVATAENMPDGDALRPGDVIRQYGGKTVEIGNTDAEGRLVMADAIVYAKEQGADVILDIATLTGACMVALGNKYFGVLGEPRSEARKVLDAADRAGEHAWELPLATEYMDAIKSDIADLRNVPMTSPGGGAITAGLFLKEFAGDTPYVHLDIAGPAKANADDFERPKWGTGVGVRTLVEYVMAQ